MHLHIDTCRLCPEVLWSLTLRKINTLFYITVAYKLLDGDGLCFLIQGHTGYVHAIREAFSTVTTEQTNPFLLPFLQLPLRIRNQVKIKTKVLEKNKNQKEKVNLPAPALCSMGPSTVSAASHTRRTSFRVSVSLLYKLRTVPFFSKTGIESKVIQNNVLSFSEAILKH